MSGFLSGFFNKNATVPGAADATPHVTEIGPDFRPTKGSFFRTQEYPEVDAQGQPIGKGWMEAAIDPKTGTWVLWQKSIRTTDDPLSDAKVSVMNSRMLFEKTTYVNCYDQMTTYEQAQQSLGLEPLPNKSPAKMGGDYFKQFAWRESLMNSRSGRLYPVEGDTVNASNFFDSKDIDARKAFIERMHTEAYVPVAIQLPVTDWKKAYEANKTQTDQRLNYLINSRYNGDKDNFDLALQVVGNETPDVLYAFLQNGFNPKIYQADADKHFKLLKAAIDRTGIDSLNLLSEAGIGFEVQSQGQTPLEVALQQHHYSHLHIMLSRDGAQLVKYADESGVTPPVAAMMLQDNQAFRMMYLEGMDFDQVDKSGWCLVHHAFGQNFMPGIYAWLDEGLNIDTTIKGTEYTGLSIARHQHNQALIDFAIKHGANQNAPEIADAAAVAQQTSKDAVATPVAEYNIAMLNSGATNDEILASAKAFVAAGGNLNQQDQKGKSLFEICWTNQKPKAELNRRLLMSELAGLGADPGAALPDGTTALNRSVGGTALDLEYVRALAPLTANANAADAKGNTILHALQLNNSEQVGLSAQVDAILKMFPTLDVNVQNKQGLSPLGLAIRLDRSQTLKLFQDGAQQPDWSQTTQTGWSYLDLAFTKACAKEKIVGCPKADRVMAASDKTRGLVLDMLDQSPPDQGAALNAVINRPRPDQQTLIDAMTSEAAPEASIERLKKFNVLKGPVAKPKLTVSPP
jgi:ankyrin repeat protein